MTRETALRRMLAGTKVEHAYYPRYFFVYKPELDCPIVMCRKRDGEIISETGGHILPNKTGWKEYVGGDA